MNSKSNKTVVVLGMHRSGTSMMAGILHILGVDMGDEGDEKNIFNPNGHFEDRIIRNLNDTMLVAAGGSWAVPPTSSQISKITLQFRDQINNIFSKKSGLWGWKDPRTVLTIDVFKNHIDNPYFFVCYRNPLDMATSLKERDEINTGGKVEDFLMLSAEYNKRISDFINNNASYPIQYVSFEEIKNTPIEVAQKAAFFLGIPFTDDMKERINNFIVPSENISNNRLRAQHEKEKNLVSRLEEQASLLKKKEQEVEFTRKYFERQLSEVNQRLQYVVQSRSWKIISYLWDFRDKVLPLQTKRRLLYNFLVHPVVTVGKTYYLINHFGFRIFINKFLEKVRMYPSYQRWIKVHEPGSRELSVQSSFEFSYKPLISIITPTYKTNIYMLEQMLESVLEQTYSDWQLCLVDGGSPREVREVLEKYAQKDKRIEVKFLEENLGISGNSNVAIGMAKGEFVSFLDHDDTLAPFALFEIVKTINEVPETEVLYSDEDKIAYKEVRFGPFLKPQWSPDTLRTYNYITHFLVIKKKLLDKIGYLSPELEGAQDYDLVIRASEEAEKITHIPKILYHWRVHENSTSGDPLSKSYAYSSGKRALEMHVARLGYEAEVEMTPYPGFYRVKYSIVDDPLISIIIPTKDKVDLLKKCLSSILAKTTYKNFEIILIENHSQEKETFKYYKELQGNYSNIKLITWKEPFHFSKVQNFAAKHAGGEIFLFLNNDTEVIKNGWLESMIEHVQRKEVGVVGAKLYYPNNTIQHGGVVIGLGGIAGHVFIGAHKGDPGYGGRLVSVSNVGAVTGACLMIRRSVFQEIGGFDENYELAFGDIDLCLGARKLNYWNVFTPYAELYHKESATRGYEDTYQKIARYNREVNYFCKKWVDVLAESDPFYNPNLTLSKGDYSLRL